MSDFETKAKELLEIADKFRNEIKSKIEVNTNCASLACMAPPVPVLLPVLLGTSILKLFSPILGLTSSVASSVIGKLIKNIQESPQGNYTTKEISAQTGIEEWKLRRYIASQELKAESNKSSDGNPGRSGYSISKNDLIKFIKANKSKIKIKTKTEMELEKESEIKKSVAINLIYHFLAHIDPVIELGNMEIKLTKLEHPEESKEVIAKEILLQKLKIEKQYFEEQHKYFVQALQNPTAENSTEQTPETK